MTPLHAIDEAQMRQLREDLLDSLAAARKWLILVMNEPMKASSMCVPDTSDNNLAASGSLGQQMMGSLNVGKNSELQHARVLGRQVDECGRFTLRFA